VNDARPRDQSSRDLGLLSEVSKTESPKSPRRRLKKQTSTDVRFISRHSVLQYTLTVKRGVVESSDVTEVEDNVRVHTGRAAT
jgi:hypothetical protein